MRLITTLISFVFPLFFLVACDDGSPKTSDPACGNDLVDGSEDCDGLNMGFSTCRNLDYFTGQHTCAWTNSGTSYCWGRNDNGIWGDGTLINRPITTEVLPRYRGSKRGSNAG